MHRPSSLALLVSLLAFSQIHAAPADAARVEKTYQLALDQWTLSTKAAATAAEREKAWSRQPDAAPFAKEMWTAIGSSLDQDWTLAPAAWFLRLTPRLTTTDGLGAAQPIFGKECDAIRAAIEAHHLSSSKLTPICTALAASNDPRTLSLLEKIQASHPDPKIQGLAALAAAIQLKSMGDDPKLMRQRLNYLRKAIIQSSDAEIDGTAVSKLAEDELYIIRFLTKGRIAPDLVGTDSAARPLSLDGSKGKVVVLLFWNSNVTDAKRVVEITTAMEAKFKGRPFAIVGVNNDPLEKLRSLQAAGTVTWPNFSDPDNTLAKQYRVGSWPLVYVLDGERKIHYAGAPGSFVELTAEALLADAKPTVKQ
jgi:peroxiredoxin